MNPWTAFGVFLVGGFGVASVAFTGGLFVAARLVQPDSSDGRESVRVAPLPASSSSTSGSGTVYHPTREDDEGGSYVLDGEPVSRERFLRETAHVERRYDDVDADSEALDRIRESDEDEIRESPRGFRGRDLSDREVERWLKRWNL